MKDKYFRILSDEEMTLIHEASLNVLEHTGMLIDHDNARDLLREAGAKVDNETKIVRFPPELVERSLEQAPRTMVYGGRDPEYDMVLQTGGNLYSRVTSGMTSYVDLQSGQLRRANSDDMKEFAILEDALPNIDCSAAIFAGDVPVENADLYSVKVLLENQRKPFVFQTFNTGNLQCVIQMMLAVRGSKEELKKRPLGRGTLGIISPLFIPEDDVDSIFLACEYGIPMGLATMINAGATAPITVAGALALTNAEALGGLTLTQVIKPGHPFPYYVIPMVTDMINGLGLLGAPENTLLVAAVSQLGREFYRIPVETFGFGNDSAICEQTLFQKAMNGLIQSLAGGDILMGVGVTDTDTSANPVHLVIDDEIMAILRRIIKGFQVDKETLGLEAIHRVGPRGNFLSDEHTLKFLRKGEQFRPTIFDRNARDTWYSKGGKDLEQKAREKALSIMKKHEVPPLPEAVLKELNLIVEKANKGLLK